MFIALIILLSAVIIIFMLKKMSLSKIILSVLTGVTSLLCCDLMLSFFGGCMPVNIHTVLISAVGGMPAVILLTLLKCFF